MNILEALKTARTDSPRQSPKVWLSQYLPSRLAEYIASHIKHLRLADMSDAALANLALLVNEWHIKPAGTGLRALFHRRSRGCNGASRRP